MIRVAIIAIAGILVVACAQQTETIKLFESPTSMGKTYEKLLVIDVSSDQDLRALFENDVVSRLEQKGVEAVPFHQHSPKGSEATQTDMNRVSKQQGADAILVTHIASVDTKLDIQEGREETISTCRGGDPLDYFLYDRKTIREPNSYKTAHTVTVITNLYDAVNEERIWTIQSTCFDSETIADGLLEEARAIVRQLTIDNLI